MAVRADERQLLDRLVEVTCDCPHAGLGGKQPVRVERQRRVVAGGGHASIIGDGAEWGNFDPLVRRPVAPAPISLPPPGFRRHTVTDEDDGAPAECPPDGLARLCDSPPARGRRARGAAGRDARHHHVGARGRRSAGRGQDHRGDARDKARGQATPCCDRDQGHRRRRVRPRGRQVGERGGRPARDRRQREDRVEDRALPLDFPQVRGRPRTRRGQAGESVARRRDDGDPGYAAQVQAGNSSSGPFSTGVGVEDDGRANCLRAEATTCPLPRDLDHVDAAGRRCGRRERGAVTREADRVAGRCDRSCDRPLHRPARPDHPGRARRPDRLDRRSRGAAARGARRAAVARLVQAPGGRRSVRPRRQFPRGCRESGRAR